MVRSDVADAVYLRVSVTNVGNESARNVEVYAEMLSRKRADGSWERVPEFPPMNLIWSNLGSMYFPRIAPEMSKHCDVGHIIDPTRRFDFGEENVRLRLESTEVSLTFDLIAKPNHQGHIVRPGSYRLDLMLAAENARPIRRVLEIELRGPWYPEEEQMLRDGVGMRVVDA